MMNKISLNITSCKPVHIHLKTARSARMLTKFIPESREERRAILQTMENAFHTKKTHNKMKNDKLKRFERVK